MGGFAHVWVLPSDGRENRGEKGKAATTDVYFLCLPLTMWAAPIHHSALQLLKQGAKTNHPSFKWLLSVVKGSGPDERGYLTYMSPCNYSFPHINKSVQQNFPWAVSCSILQIGRNEKRLPQTRRFHGWGSTALPAQWAALCLDQTPASQRDSCFCSLFLATNAVSHTNQVPNSFPLFLNSTPPALPPFLSLFIVSSMSRLPG